MLVKLNLDIPDKIEAWNKHVEEVALTIKNDKEAFMSACYINDISAFVSPVSVEDPKQRRCPDGFYSFRFSFEHSISDLLDINIKNNYSSFLPDTLEGYRTYKNPRNNYGMCDNYKQVLKEYPELKKDKNRKFVVEMNPIFNNTTSGFRWHKNGRYIGKHKIQCEYFCDEVGIDKIYLYHIYEIEEIKC